MLIPDPNTRSSTNLSTLGSNIRNLGSNIPKPNSNNILAKTLHASSLELWAPHIYASRSSPSIALEAEVKAILDAKAEELEQRLQRYARFKLVREGGALLSFRSHIELEEEEHPLAEAKPKDYKLEVHHPQDKRIRATIDLSRGKDRPELVFKHRLTAPADRDQFNEQFNAWLEGDIDLRDIPKMKNALKQVFEVLRPDLAQPRQPAPDKPPESEGLGSYA